MASLPALATGANTIGAVTQASGPWTINQTQINGSAVSTAASGVQKVGVVGSSGAALDTAAGSSATQAIGIQGVTGGVAVPASQSGTWNITNVNGTVSLPTGAATAANQTNGNAESQIIGNGNLAYVDANHDIYTATNYWGAAALGAASAIGTESSGNVITVNSHITGCVGTVCPTTGQKTAAGSSPVVPASDVAAPVGGLAAAGTTDTDVPVNGGGRAATTSPTAVTDGQKVAAMMTPEGKTVVALNAPSALRWQTPQVTTATNTTLLAGNSTPLKTYLTDIDCGRVDAGTTAQTIDITDAASNNILHIIIPNNGG
ncbi:MAG: hypothetical protein ACLPXZ_29185, partial [Mycobacterium sp.]